MANELATKSETLMESVVIGGDLSQLSPGQRVQYYMSTCNSLGLNPLTKPFDYIRLNGKLVLYARKDAADQLRKINNVSLGKPETELINGIVTVSITASTPDGRTDADMGAVNVEGLKGDALANAMMKAITKAKRRVTLSICGLGMLDETEIETIHDAAPVVVDHNGVIADGKPADDNAPTKEAWNKWNLLLDKAAGKVSAEDLDKFIEKSTDANLAELRKLYADLKSAIES